MRGENGLVRLAISKPNSRKEEAVCVVCGATFEDTIYIRADGSEVPSSKLCRDCEAKARVAERVEAYKVELAEECKHGRLRWRQQYGVMGLLCEKTFEGFDSSLQPKAFEVVSKWQKGSLVLLSPNSTYGVGKTHLVAALANRLIESVEPAFFRGESYQMVLRSCPVYFITESRLLSRIRDTYNEGAQESEEDILVGLSKFMLLIVDDVGKRRPRDYSFLQGTYFRVIDDRYTLGRDVILTTNLSIDDLVVHVGEAVSDRLREMCGKHGFITMKGESYRSKK